MTEINSFEFNFELQNMDNAFDFAKVGCMELAVYAYKALAHTGTYQFKLIVSELDDKSEVNQNRVEKIKQVFEEAGVYDTNPCKMEKVA